MDNNDINDGFFSCLEATQFLSLATTSDKGPWVCPLFFAYDTELSLFVLSKVGDRHMTDLQDNDQVSIAIYPTDQNLVERVHGVQMSATASIISKDEATHAFNTYFARSPRDPAVLGVTPETYTAEGAEWRIIKLSPKDVFYVNSMLFGHGRKKVPRSQLITK